jgi:hypothetical protein
MRGGNYQGQAVGISRSTGGDTKANWWGNSKVKDKGERHRGQGKKKWWGVHAPSLTTPTQKGVCSSSFDGKGNVLAHGFFPNNDECRGMYFDK